MAAPNTVFCTVKLLRGGYNLRSLNSNWTTQQNPPAKTAKPLNLSRKTHAKRPRGQTPVYEYPSEDSVPLTLETARWKDITRGLSFGSGSDVDIRLDLDNRGGVSAIHFRLEFCDQSRPDILQLVNLSRNGTIVNGQRLEPLSTIRLGSTNNAMTIVMAGPVTIGLEIPLFDHQAMGNTWAAFWSDVQASLPQLGELDVMPEFDPTPAIKAWGFQPRNNRMPDSYASNPFAVPDLYYGRWDPATSNNIMAPAWGVPNRPLSDASMVLVEPFSCDFFSLSGEYWEAPNDSALDALQTESIWERTQILSGSKRKSSTLPREFGPAPSRTPQQRRKILPDDMQTPSDPKKTANKRYYTTKGETKASSVDACANCEQSRLKCYAGGRMSNKECRTCQNLNLICGFVRIDRSEPCPSWASPLFNQRRFEATSPISSIQACLKCPNGQHLKLILSMDEKSHRVSIRDNSYPVKLADMLAVFMSTKKQVRKEVVKRLGSHQDTLISIVNDGNPQCRSGIWSTVSGVIQLCEELQGPVWYTNIWKLLRSSTNNFQCESEQPTHSHLRPALGSGALNLASI